MRPASFQNSSYLNRVSLPSRATALLVAIVLSALIVFMLLKLGTRPPHVPDDLTKPIVVQLLPAAGAPRARAESTAQVHRPRPPIQPPLPPPPIPTLNMLVLSHDEFAATDISRLSRQPKDAGGDANAGAGDGTAAQGAGQGPGGEPLYDAEWYREPTHAEMVTYLPSGAPEKAWAMIACRTIERYHVEDCQELAESPPGSGLSRALRQAAWQFLVRPPRIGGKSLVGAWVRIRFDFTRENAKEPRSF
jgi:protein TonB